jgi:sugar phosphate isomerase/epimerase
MKFGASIWPIQWAPPSDAALRRIGAAGFRAVELVGWNAGFLRDYYTDATIAELRAILNGEGLELSQFVSTPPGLSAADAAERAAAVEQWRRACAVGAALGTRLVNQVAQHGFAMTDGAEIPRLATKPLVQTFAAAVPSGLDWDRNYADYIAALRSCAEVAEAADVGMTVEPHPGRYMGNTDGALRILEQVDHPALSINFDPSHTYPLGDFPNISIYRLGRRISHCHASDNDAVTNVHWRPGAGKIDWHQMLTALRDVGYDGVVSIEIEDFPGRSPGARMFPPGQFRNIPCDDDFIAESVRGMDYLKQVAREVGITVED